MSFKIVHLVNDEKFINFIADIFNACEGVTNHFLAIVPDSSAPLKYISGLENLRIIDKKHIYSGSINSDLAGCDALVVHLLDTLKAKILLNLQKNIPVLWSGWGADYYDYLSTGTFEFLGTESKMLNEVLVRQRYQSTSKFYLVKKNVTDYLRASIKSFIINKSIDRTDYFSSPVPEDYDLLVSRLGKKFKSEYVQINYGSVEKTFSLGTKEITGDDILVGNSASATNNHLEVFQLLSRFDLSGRKIIVPLSYGDKDYRDAVVEHGRKFFGNSFHALVDFMPLEQYNNVIANCSMVVMGHRRQQAVGNTATMLYKGAKVFLDEKSTVYSFFKHRGAFVYGLNELINCEKSIYESLTDEQKLKNREVLTSFWGKEVVLKNTQKLIKVLKSHKK